jgi:hypothetical protein
MLQQSGKTIFVLYHPTQPTGKTIPHSILSSQPDNRQTKITLCNSCNTANRQNTYSSVLPILSNDNNIRQNKSQCVTHATQPTGKIPVSPMQQSKQKKPQSFCHQCSTAYRQNNHPLPPDLFIEHVIQPHPHPYIPCCIHHKNIF